MPAVADDNSCFPRLYVYGLEQAWRDPTQHQRWGFEAQAFAGITPMFRIGTSVDIYEVGQWSLGELIYQRTLAYSCRTDNASLADIFFIPAFSARFEDSNFTSVAADASKLVSRAARPWSARQCILTLTLADATPSPLSPGLNHSHHLEPRTRKRPSPRSRCARPPPRADASRGGSSQRRRDGAGETTSWCNRASGTSERRRPFGSSSIIGSCSEG